MYYLCTRFRRKWLAYLNLRSKLWRLALPPLRSKRTRFNRFGNENSIELLATADRLKSGGNRALYAATRHPEARFAERDENS
jgi:hypothetical protein